MMDVLPTHLDPAAEPIPCELCGEPVIPCPTVGCFWAHGWVHASNQEHWCEKEQVWELAKATPPDKYLEAV